MKTSAYHGIDFQIHNTGMLIFDQEDFDVGLNYASQYQEPMQQCNLLERKQLEQINRIFQKNFNKPSIFPTVECT